MDVPEVSYARSGNTAIAYQAVGDGLTAERVGRLILYTPWKRGVSDERERDEELARIRSWAGKLGPSRRARTVRTRPESSVGGGSGVSDLRSSGTTG